MKHLCSVLLVCLVAIMLSAQLAGEASAHSTTSAQSQSQQHALHPAASITVWKSAPTYNCASQGCGYLGNLPAGGYDAQCQLQGSTVADEGYTNSWWSYISGHGWISNIYIKGGYKIDGVPDC